MGSSRHKGVGGAGNHTHVGRGAIFKLAVGMIQSSVLGDSCSLWKTCLIHLPTVRTTPSQSMQAAAMKVAVSEHWKCVPHSFREGKAQHLGGVAGWGLGKDGFLTHTWSLPDVPQWEGLPTLQLLLYWH